MKFGRAMVLFFEAIVRFFLAGSFCFISNCAWRHFTGVDARAGLWWFCGRSRCRAAAFEVLTRFMLAIFFSTISHCAWRPFIGVDARALVVVGHRLMGLPENTGGEACGCRGSEGEGFRCPLFCSGRSIYVPIPFELHAGDT